MRIASDIGMMVLFMAIWHAITHWLGVEFMTNLTAFLFDDYIALWMRYMVPILPGFGHPAVTVMIIAFIVMSLPGLLRISRFVASFIVALFAVRAAFFIFGAEGAPEPSFTLGAMALASLGWLFLASAIGDGGLWAWLRGLHRVE